MSGKAIGARIKQRRKELKISQERLAEALDVSYQQLQRYENGSNLLNTDKLQAVAKFLNVPCGYFVEDAGNAAGMVKAARMTPDEVSLLRLFKRCGQKYKKAVLLFMKLAATKRR
ncbi:MAG: helix-turn-helix transcriptional regulator [Deltaproteobacteria bacterium]|nr:helix-turn-helix transcriptional regulator [Deltaproteobacteria bacterium]